MGITDFFFRKSSSHVAKDRLKMVLVSDRANCSPDVLEQIKKDLIFVLSKYVEIDLEGLDIKIGYETDGKVKRYISIHASQNGESNEKPNTTVVTNKTL